MKRVLLVEDHAVFRQALAYLLARDAEIERTDEAGSLAEARRCLGNLENGNVVVVDSLLPDGDGDDLIRELRETAVRVLGLTDTENREVYSRMLEAGADEVLSKSASVTIIVSSVAQLCGSPENGRSPIWNLQRHRLSGWSYRWSSNLEPT